MTSPSDLPSSSRVRYGDEESAQDAPWPHVMLLLAGLWAAWQPAEGHALTPLLVSVVLLALVSWGWRWTDGPILRQSLAAGSVVALWLVLAALAGASPARSVAPLSLGVGIALTVWLASRRPPPASFPVLLALGLALLAVWGGWQSVAGLERAAGALSQVPEELHVAFMERIESGRGFASLPLPGHLAVLMATALPLLVGGLPGGRLSVLRVAGAGLCVLGLVVSRSPLGVLLALAAVICVLAGDWGRRRWLVVGLLAACLLVVVAWRADVLRLEPVQLRLDNWRTAIWAFGTSPLAGVGPGGFAHLARQASLELGNRPAHAHSLPLEWLAELGPAGLAVSVLLAATLFRLAAALWPPPPAMAAALLVVPIHNLVDFSLYVSGVALPWAVLLGWSLAEVRGSGFEVRAGPRIRTALIAGLAVAVGLTGLNLTGRWVGDAAERAVDATSGYRLAVRAHAVAPWRVRPLATMAWKALGSDDARLVQDAAHRLDRWRWLSPESAAFSALRMRLALRTGDPARAATEAWEACRLETGDVRFCQAYARVVETLERSHGAP